MFYPAELITSTRRGKLAKCWLVATCSEQQCKKFGLGSIKSIDIRAICDEILQTVEIRPNRPYGRRFSLYLSSQLMYGAVKLLLYQTRSVERELFLLRNQLFLNSEVTENEMDVLSNFELPDMPPATEGFNNLQIDKDLHLISDEPNLNAGVELMMHAECLNFGIMTDDELEFMLMLDDHLQDMGIVESREVGISPSAHLPCNQESFMEDILTKETRVQQMQSDKLQDVQKEPLITGEDVESHTIMDYQPAQDFCTIVQIEPEIGILQTPKRCGSKELEISTPTKRRRLHFDDVQSQQPMAVEDACPLILEPMSVDHNVAVPTQKRKARKAIDNKKEIETKNIIRRINNIMAHTKPRDRAQVNIPSATELFKMPTTCMQKIHKKTWGKPLHIIFNKNIHTAITTEVQAVAELNTDIDELTITDQEIVRATHTISKTMDVGELSTAVEGMTIETDYSKILGTTHNEMLQVLPLTPVRSELQEQIPESIHMETASVRETKSSSSLTQNGKLSKIDLLAMLEVHWHDTEIIQFNEVICPSSYTVSDAARAFKYLLELHSEGKIILKQTQAYEPIWIQKC